MPKTILQTQSDAVAKFRLKRHHLLDGSAADLVTICRDICGAQAQVMSAAYLQLWTRNHAITRPEIEGALWKTRTLVKTSLMRQTLHLVPTDEFPLYIAALRPSRLAGALRIMARCGIGREEGEALTPVIMDALSSGPLGRAAIAAAIRPKVSKRVRAWMEKVWSHVRVPVAEGLICYGAGEGNDVCFIRVDHWLPKMKVKLISAIEAQCALFRKYLRAYGPASATDFAHWSGISTVEAKSMPGLLESELVEISNDKKKYFLLRDDLALLKKANLEKDSVRLLPSFDSYLLAHREKDHLLSAKHYKRVYRNQGWISPVVLINGTIAGVWSYKLQNKKLLVTIEPFGVLSRAIRADIAQEAEGLGKFYGTEVEPRFA
jgi:hypothetical protein